MHIGQALDLVSRYDSLRNPLTSLGDYLDPELISRCLAESGTVTLRKRRLPLEMMVWCIVGMALERKEPLHQIVNRLDIMLPGVDGYELMEYIQPTGTPVIFLTAKGMLADRVRGLRMGADDYMIKPFEPLELLARVESVLRRAGRGSGLLRAFDVVVDPTARRVEKNGVPVALTPREFDLLVLLLRNQGIALYRDVMYERVWGGEEEAGSRTLDLHIQRLRKKLGLADQIKTVYKVGYLLEVET